jgi:hypothetical protein
VVAVADGAAQAAPGDTPVLVLEPDSVLAELAASGLENLSRAARDSAALVTYENRRFRLSTEAFARVARVVPAPFHAFERRLGLVCAQIDSADGRFRVAYPSDAGFRPPPHTPTLWPTRWLADLDVVPLITYELGRIFSPVQVRVELQPSLSFSPWPGGQATAAIILPLRNDFEPTALEPDLNRVRPGPLSFHQFLWLRGVALLSASAGYFGDERYGGSIGVARPLYQGEVLLDAQADLTGFLAFPETGVLYSAARHVSGFAGLTWRPRVPGVDLALTARAARYLYGDRGLELEMRRTLGDLDLAYFVQANNGPSVNGVRVSVPLPPAHRATGAPVRVQLVPRFPIDLRNTSVPAGEYLGGVASRTDYLRLLSAPSLDAHAHTPPARAAAPGSRGGEAPLDWVSASGMTGFVFTPWAGVMADRAVELGYHNIPRAFAFEQRDTTSNAIYYATLGFLPRLETSLRWTHIVGTHAFSAIVPDSRLPDVDRMASVRFSVLTPGVGRPGLALGVEDLEGTRRFHSSYAVTGSRFSLNGLPGRATLGYGFRVFHAVRRTLDGPFGAFEISPGWRVVTQVEYDSEKWNAGLGVALPFGVRVRAELLNFESVSLGFGWSVSL